MYTKSKFLAWVLAASSLAGCNFFKTGFSSSAEGSTGDADFVAKPIDNDGLVQIKNILSVDDLTKDLPNYDPAVADATFHWAVHATTSLDARYPAPDASTIQISNTEEAFPSLTLPNQRASYTVMLYCDVAHGKDKVTKSVLLTINDSNDAPTDLQIVSAATSITSGQTVSLSGTATDVDSPSLTYAWRISQITSNDAGMVPEIFTIVGGNTNNASFVLPTSSADATISVEMSVSDEESTRTVVKVLNFTGTHTSNAPTISNSFSNTSLVANSGYGPTAFTIADTDSTIGSLTVTATSSNTGLVPNANITIGGSGANRTLSISPTANATGTTTITITVGDGTNNTTATFNLTYTAAAPTFNYIGASGTTGTVGSAMSVSPNALVANGSAITACALKVGSANAGSFPAGLSINSTTCVISGTPTGTLSATTFTISATNGAGTTDATVALTINAAVPTITYADTSVHVGDTLNVSPTLATHGASVTACAIKSGSANAGSFPGTLSINSTTCAITGTVSATLAATTFTIQATNSAGNSTNTGNFKLTVGALAPSITMPASGSFTIGQAGSVSPSTLNDNGSSITNCTVSPALPAGLSINTTTCAISGTPSGSTSSGSFTVTATNGQGSNSGTITIGVVAGSPTLTMPATGSFTIGQSGTLNPSTLSGNGSVITNCTVSPALPAGLSINTTTCVISGTSTAASPSSTSYTVTATNAQGTANGSVTISVVAAVPSVTYADTSVHVGDTLNVSPTLKANGASVTACAIKSGSANAASFPGTLSINATTCAITGTVTAMLATTTFTVQATNSVGGSTETSNFKLTVGAAAPSLIMPGTGSFTIGQSGTVNPSTFTDNGASITSCTISPALPAGLSINNTTCVISGTSSAASPSSTSYTVTATNSQGSATSTITIGVVAGSPAITLPASGSFTIGQSGSISPSTLTGNGSAITNCSISPALPTGLSINNTTCVISGTSTATGPTSTSYTITATNAQGTATGTITISVVAAIPTLTYADTSVSVGATLNVTPTLNTNGASVTACAIKSGSANAGSFPGTLSINATTCAITGTVSSTLAATTFTIQATNSVGNSGNTGNFKLTIGSSAPSITMPTSTSFTIGQSGSVNPSTLNDNGSAITNCSVSPALPAGLSINTTTCVISGTSSATSPSNTSYTVTATNAQGSSNSSVTIAVNADKPTLSYPTGTQNGQVGTAFSVSATLVANGASVTSCALKSGATNSLLFPSALSINATTCAITGTPVASLSATTYTIVATNSVGTSSDATITIAIAAAVPSLDYASATGTTGTVGTAMHVIPNKADSNGAAITACGIKSGSANAGAFPAALHFDNNCEITGTPTAVLATTTFTIVATNSAGTSSAATVSLTINPGLPLLDYTGATGTTGTVGTAMSVTPIKADGQGASITACGIKSGSANAGAFPASLSINASTCVISGTPTASLSATTFTLIATNSVGTSTPATVSLTINAAKPTLDYSGSSGTTGTANSAMSITPSTLHDNGAAITACGIKSGSTNASSFPGTLSVNASTCVISGTPTAALSATTFTLVATNSVGTSSDATVSITISAAGGGGSGTITDLGDFGASSLQPRNFVASGTNVFFTAGDATNGRELWVSDGTAAGTHLVKDICAGTCSSSPSEITSLGTKVIFAASSARYGREVWVSDGTSAGTTMIADINTQNDNGSKNDDSNPRNFFRLKNDTNTRYVIFSAYNGSGTYSSHNQLNRAKYLYRTDGTTVELVSTAVAGAHEFERLGDYLYFSGFNTATNDGFQLWKTDGKTVAEGGTTTEVKQINTTGDASPTMIRNISGKLYFIAKNNSGFDVYSSDGTTANTTALNANSSNAISISSTMLAKFGTKLVFSGTVSGRHDFYAVDTTNATTSCLTCALTTAPGKVYHERTVDSVVYIATEETSGGTHRVWVSDGTVAGTKIINTATPTYAPTQEGGTDNRLQTWFTYLGTTLFFGGHDATAGNELWSSNGTDAGTQLAKDILAGTGNSTPEQTFGVGGKLYMSAYDGTHRHLYLYTP